MADAILQVRTPATSANLGAGFDTLGMALSLYNIFTVTEILPEGEFRAAVIGEGARELTDAKDNMVIRSYIEACDTWNIKGAGFELLSNNVIPLCRGLGSSASAAVAGVLIANGLNRVNASDDEMLRVITRIEKHPDNVAPCYLGGMTVSCLDGESLRYVRLPSLPPDMYVVVAVPNVEVRTSMAREALPDTVDFKDAVFNLGRSALMAAAWATGRWELLSWGMDDRIHQQYRAKLFPGGDVIMDRVRDIPGCLGAAISGSGPSVLALVKGRPRKVAETMCRTFTEYGVESLFFVLQGNADGAKVTYPGQFLKKSG
ncbi:homoserine kinase [Synergistales bacterium]|nr:homoserine kinase [Synergistales bacterium]GHV54994.1 homoserine kinase [Synergistales bacterium]